jgi:hypothetical protein
LFYFPLFPGIGTMRPDGVPMRNAPILKHRSLGMRCSIAALMGLVLVLAAVSRWPPMLFPAAVLLGIYIDELRLSVPRSALVVVVLSAALAIALATRFVEYRRRVERLSGPKIVPSTAAQGTRPNAAVSGNLEIRRGGPLR